MQKANLTISINRINIAYRNSLNHITIRILLQLSKLLRKILNNFSCVILVKLCCPFLLKVIRKSRQYYLLVTVTKTENLNH